MTAKQYLSALKKLGLGVASQQTAALLGISIRHSQRIAAGDADVSPTLIRLLRMYLKHGLPD